MNLIEIPIGSLTASKTNPRTEFPADYIKELAASIRQRGIFNPLLVRSLSETAPVQQYELIAGECRLRAAREAGVASVPVIVRDDLENEDVLELQLMENLQRKDLSVLEEADGLAALLDMRGSGSAPRWTVDSLAEKLGKTPNYVRQRLLLRRLTPDGRKALADGSLSFSVARLVCRIPSEKLREKALVDVLKPEFEDEPLSNRKAETHIRARYMVDLKGAPWKMSDAELVPVLLGDADARCFGGACLDCPFLAGNNPEEFADVVAGGRVSNICTHPECYTAKLNASWEEERMAALKAGKKVLSDDEAEKVLNPHGTGIKWDSTYVPLNDKVSSQDLRVDFKNPPTWKKLIAGSPAAPEIVVVRDQRGRPLELVDRRQAVAAIKLAAKQRGEEPAIRTGRSSELGTEEKASEKARLRERQKVAKAMAFEAMDALRQAIQERGMPDGFWESMRDVAIGFAGGDGLWLICKWLSVEPDEKEYGQKDYASAFLKSIKGATGNDLVSLVVLLLLSRGMKWAASPQEHTGPNSHDGTTDQFEAFAKAYGIDLAEIRKRVKASVSGKVKVPKRSVEEAAEDFKKQADAGVRETRKEAAKKLVEKKPAKPSASAAKKKPAQSAGALCSRVATANRNDSLARTPGMPRALRSQSMG